METKVYRYKVIDAPKGQHFVFANGATAKNLVELALHLKDMDLKTFKTHVNREKNDFSEWVRYSLKNEELASQLARVIMKDKTEILILRNILEQSDRLN